MTTRVVPDESSLEKSTRLLQMSVGERLRINSAIVIIVELKMLTRRDDPSSS